MKALASKAREYNHATTVQAALVAQAAKVNKLVLTHLSSRYNQKTMNGYKRSSKYIS